MTTIPKEGTTMTNNTGPADLRALLDSLTDGEHVKATWAYGKHAITVEGPVLIDGLYCECYRVVRWSITGEINGTLTAFEVTRDEDVTATRDDETALNDLLDSLEEGETVTAEWRSEAGTMTLTGAFRTVDPYQEVQGYAYGAVRWPGRKLHEALYSVTARRTTTQRWERENNE